MSPHEDIRIGTIVPAGPHTISYLEQIAPHGFESYQLVFDKHLADVDLNQLAHDVKKFLALADREMVISSLGVYGNPLEDKQTQLSWFKLIEKAEAFGCNMVCGFAGRLTDKPISESYGRFGEVFRPMARQAEDMGVRIAFENCNMGGDWEKGEWNIAHAPVAWEAMFSEVPSDALGLEWEPCHQMVSLIDPLPQLREWVSKVYHVHGKDATVLWDVIRKEGIRSGKDYVYHRTPGFGDTNWSDVISILRMNGYQGTIDIEGWHDPVYHSELEMTGQVHALNYLKTCRGGPFIPNPRMED
ncbi:Xylose isomerase domain-containing protein TIM barrel [Planctomycetales bacterium 10988]|nr:Xylose isomerase domain-containing protein TIM barrel [Planctomycetales bacterium 10988]